MVRRLGLGKNNHLTYASLALNPRIVLLHQQLTLLLVLVFSTLPFMARVRRFNARKDCLVCIVGVIAGGHYDQGRDLNAKLHDHYFIFNGFISKDCL